MLMMMDIPQELQNNPLQVICLLVSHPQVILMPLSTITRTIGTVEKSGYSTDCAVPMGGDGCYTPINLSANVGDKIIMTNTDSTGVHSFTSGTVDGFAPSPDGTFDTGVLMSGDSFEWTPTVSGEYPYYCLLHAWQVGTISVN